MKNNHKLIMESWRRFVNEPEEQELLEESIVTTTFAVLSALNTAGVTDIEINNSNYSIPQVKDAIELIAKTDKLDMEQKVDAIESIHDAASKTKMYRVDLDRDSYSDTMVTNAGDIQINAQLGDVDALFYLNAVAGYDAGSDVGVGSVAEMPQDLKVTKVDDGSGAIDVQHKRGKKLTQQQIKQIAADNGITGNYTLHGYTNNGVMITPN